MPKEQTHVIAWDREKALNIMGQRPLITKYNKSCYAELTWCSSGEQMLIVVGPLTVGIARSSDNILKNLLKTASVVAGNRPFIWQSVIDQSFQDRLRTIEVDPASLQTEPAKYFHRSLFQCRGAYADELPPTEQEKILMYLLMRLQFCTSIDAVINLLDHPRKQPDQ